MTTEVERTEVEAEARGPLERRNWFGDLTSQPRRVVEARSVDDIVAAVRDPEQYPAPVRGRGSAHSTTLCGEADGGTIVDMRQLNRIVSIGPGTVTAEAGALLIDVAKELERRGLQFYVNIELGNASLGSIACCATKDASMPGELGQANSYCVGMKLVTASGELLEVTGDDPELLQAGRSSYGLFGIVYEVTFKIRPLQAMAVEHHVYKLDAFTSRLPELFDRGQSMMMYIFPYLDRIAVEFRQYGGPEAEATSRVNHGLWRLRNYVWKSFAPGVGYAANRFVPSRRVRFGLVNALNRGNQMAIGLLKSSNTIATDQMIRYPKVAGRTRYTFSIWAFPEDQYGETLREYFRFAKDYYRRTGFRPNILHVGYRIEQDQSSLFSYTYDSRVLTIDPVSTGGPGWREFLAAYNDFCSEHGGQPLFNQSWGITPEQARRAFGERLDRFEEIRRRLDPEDRFLNGHFRQLLPQTQAAS